MRLLFIFFSISFITACSFTPDAGAIYQTRYDFTQVKSYSLYDRNAESRSFQSLPDVLKNSIELAIERNLDRQGLQYLELEQADVIVSYHVVGKKNQDYKEYNKAVLYCEYCLRASTWQTEKKNWTIEHGSLIIDLVDPKTKRSVWRSVSQLDIKAKDNSQQYNEKIKEAVQLMIALYPK